MLPGTSGVRGGVWALVVSLSGLGRAGLAGLGRAGLAGLGGRVGVVRLGGGFEGPLVDDIIRDDNKNSTQLTKKLLGDLLPDGRKLLLGKVCWQLLDRLDVVERLHATIGRRSRRSQLENRSRVVGDDLNTTPWVRSQVTLAKNLQDGDANTRGRGDQVADGNMLESIWTFVSKPEEERTKRVPDLARIRKRSHENVIASLRILAAAGLVHDDHDWSLLPQEHSEHTTNIT